MTWRRLLVLLRHLPTDSASVRAVDPERALWGLGEQLLAGVADSVRGGNWQRGGGKGSKPRPIPRPGVGPTETVRRHGQRPRRPPAEVAAYLARFAPRPEGAEA